MIRTQNVKPISQIIIEKERQSINPDLVDAYEAIAAQQEIINSQSEAILALQEKIAILKGGA